MAFSATKITLSPSLQQALERISQGEYPLKVSQRARIVLLASEGLSNGQIAGRVGLCRDTCSAWRVRFAAEIKDLDKETGDEPSALEKRVAALLEDEPRPGRPVRFTKEQIERIRELSEKDPQAFGIHAKAWSCSSLAKTAVNEGIVSSISAKTIWRYAQRHVLTVGEDVQ